MWQVFAAASVQGWFGNQVGKAQAKIDTRVSATNAAATNQVTRAQNLEMMARNSLSRYVQSVNNNRMLDDGGDALTGNVISGLRALDSNANQQLLTSVQGLEEVGAAQASQAQAQIGGQVVDMINSTTLLRKGISQELQRQSGEDVQYEVGTRSRSIMSQMAGGLDASLIIDNINTRQAVAQQAYAPSNGQAIFSSVLQTALKAGVGNVAEWGSEQLGKLLPSGTVGTGIRAGVKSNQGLKTFSFNTARFGNG